MSATEPSPTSARRRGAAAEASPAIVLRRSDFRESSRIVTCLAREHGRVTALAKGAHRGDSVFLGRLDFLNEVRATWGPDRGGLRLLVRAELVRERRALREPRRFLAASHLASLCEFATPDGRAEPAVYDLLVGGLNLLERCPAAALGQIVLGLELRFLASQGALPDLDHCGDCGRPLEADAFRNRDGPGLVCRDHAELPRVAIGSATLRLLRSLHRTTGRQWPELAADVSPRLAATLPGLWLAAATELRPRLRPLLFELLA